MSFSQPSTFVTFPTELPIKRTQTAISNLKPPLSTRRTEDTSFGCRNHAAASLIAAAAKDTINGRLRMEASAAAWATRAEMLARLEQQQSARSKAK